jgi:capsular polysaccharide biosynthesis protein
MTNREERDQRVLELEALAGDGGAALDPDVPTAVRPDPVAPPRDPIAPAAHSSRVSTRPRWLGALIAVIVAVAAGALTYVISNAVPATYKASTQVQVTVNEASGLGQDSVLAGNQLTAQLAQLLPTDAVLSRPAAALEISTAKLRSALSVGSVAQQNILQVSTTASSKSTAELRATAVTAGLLAYMSRTARAQQHAYRQAVAGAVGAMNRQLAGLAGRRGKLTSAQLGVIQGEAGAIAGQAQSLATSIPVLQVIQPATTANKVTPKPLLYAIVALLVVGFVALQLATMRERPAR